MLRPLQQAKSCLSSWIFWLIALSACYRIFLISFVKDQPIAWHRRLFHQALSDHLWEYLTLNVQKVHLSKVILALPYKLFSLEDIVHYRIEYYYAGLLSILSIIVLYLTAKELIKRPAIAFAVMLFYSLATGLWEIYWGADYVVSGMLILAIFAYANVRILQRGRSRTNLILLALCGGLLTFHFEVQTAIVPLAIVAALFLIHKRRVFSRIFVLDLGFSLSPSLLVILLMTLRTYYAVGTINNGSLGGGHMMRHLLYWYKEDLDTYRAEMQRLGAPDWFLWCYDRSEMWLLEHGKPFDPENSKLIDHATRVIYRTTGNCFYSHDETKQTGSCWPYDYAPLAEYLAAQDLPDHLRIVKLDMERSCKKPYLYVGNAVEAGSLWTGVYGGASYDLAKKIIAERPIEFLLYGVDRHILFAKGGPNGFLTHSDLTLANKLDSLGSGAWLFRNIVRSFVALMRYFYFLYIPLGVMSAFWFLFRKKLGDSWHRYEMETFSKVQIVLGLQIFVAAFLFNNVTCCEWARLFEQLVPFLLILLIVWSDKFLQLCETKILKRG